MATSERPRGEGFERRDAHLRGVLAVGAALLALTAVAAALMVVAFNLLAARERREQIPLTPVAAAGGDQAAPEPRLQSTPVADLAAFREEQRALTETYGWVDREAGVVRIPVEAAMTRLVERGMPESWGTGAPPPGPAAGGAR